MANILVTGVAGFVGSHTADKLLSEGHRVWGIDDLRTGCVRNISAAIAAGLDFRQMSVLDFPKLNRLVRESKVDAIIHLAALVSVTESIKRPDINFRLNLEGTFTVAEAARLNGTPRVVFASSAAVYGNTTKMPIAEGAQPQPISPYGAAKVASEHLLLSYATSYGMVVRIQRYFNIFGRRQDPSSPYSGVISIFVRNFCQQKPTTIYGDGRQTRDFINVADVARANLMAATRPAVVTGIANICTGRSISLLALHRELSLLAPVKPLRFAPARQGDIRHSVGSTASAFRAFGFKSNIAVAAGLKGMLVENTE